MSFIIDVRRAYPLEIGKWIEEDGFVFSWGGSGLKPACKKRLVKHKLATPASFNALIGELENKDFRAVNPPQLNLGEGKLGLKFESGGRSVLS